MEHTHEISRISRKQKARYRVRKSPIMNQINPIHASRFWKMQFNIILPSTPGCCKWSFSLKFLYQNPVYTSPPCVLHAPSISFSISSLEQYYVVFSTRLLPRPS